MDKFFDQAPKIIAAAAKSPLGIVALTTVALFVLAFFFFADAPVSVRVGIFIGLGAGYGLFTLATMRSMPGKQMLGHSGKLEASKDFRLLLIPSSVARGLVDAIRSLRKKPPAEPQVAHRQSIADRLVSDRPLRPGDPDPLGYRHIAKGISRFLRNEKTEPPLTLAIFGEWGTGKSSIMNLLKGDLERFSHQPVWFNAWHHQKEEHLLASLLETLRLSAFSHWWTLRGLAFRGRLFWIRICRNPSLLILVATLVAAQVAFLLVIPPSDFTKLLQSVAASPDWLKKIYPELPYLPGVAAALALGFTLHIHFRNTLLDPARLAAAVAGRLRVRQFRDNLSFRHRFAQEFRDVTEALKPLKLVILIDDLDRCSAENVLELLEAVNFLVSSGDCFIIMGLDRERVLGSLSHAFADESEDLVTDADGAGKVPEKRTAHVKRVALAQQYLEKLINIEVPVPPLRPEDARALLMSAAKEKPLAPQVIEEPRSRRFRRGLLAVAVPLITGAVIFGFGWLLKGAPEEGTLAVSLLETKYWLGMVGISAAGFAVLATSAALTYQRRMRMVGAIIDDSKDFQDALDIWYPLIGWEFHTPRALKRFLNHLRYLAMCNRRDPEEEGEPLHEEIDEATLVALAAAKKCYPGGLDKLLSPKKRAAPRTTDDDESEGVATPSLDELIKLITSKHGERFDEWPPPEPARRRFEEIAAGIRIK